MADSDRMGRVITQTFDQAFQTRGRSFQTLGRAFEPLRELEPRLIV